MKKFFVLYKLAGFVTWAVLFISLQVLSLGLYFIKYVDVNWQVLSLGLHFAYSEQNNP
jgi:hypothetical protein